MMEPTTSVGTTPVGATSMGTTPIGTTSVGTTPVGATRWMTRPFMWARALPRLMSRQVSRGMSRVTSMALPMSTPRALSRKLAIPRLLGGVVGSFLAVSTLTSAGADASNISVADIRTAKAAFKAISEGKWKTVRYNARRVKDPLLAKVLKWEIMTRPGSDSPFAEVSGFIQTNPEWPRQRALKALAETRLPASWNPDDVLAWFAKHPPISIEGHTRNIRALLQKGKTDPASRVKAIQQIRDIWVRKNFTRAQERRFHKSFNRHLTAEHHWQRLDRLLWDGNNRSTRRMLWRVKGDRRLIAEARFLLRHRRGNVDRAIAKIPHAKRSDPALAYERLRWRRRKGKDLSARELLASLPDDLPHPEKWWKERSVLSHRALLKGHVSAAYRIARDHGQKSGGGFAEAEWMAGWVALRFMNDAKTAKQHFDKMYNAVRYPISLARGAYWSGRADEALGDSVGANKWYAIAAGLPKTYYGQLAASRTTPKQNIIMPPDPKPSDAERAAFATHELVNIARTLSELRQLNRMKPFLLRLGTINTSPGWQSLAGALSADLGRRDIAVKLSKKATILGISLTAAGYPAPVLPSVRSRKVKKVEAPLVLAMIRQESAFHDAAKSHAGARGLLQLIPPTALRVARFLGLPYSKKRLISDPNFNLRLGQTYISQMLTEFNGSYVMALAAYNAGPSRVRRWVRNNGNPQSEKVDVVDWIELIAFSETRNYVQRVMENVQIYRHRLTETVVAQTLEGDLKR